MLGMLGDFEEHVASPSFPETAIGDWRFWIKILVIVVFQQKKYLIQVNTTISYIGSDLNTSIYNFSGLTSLFYRT